MSQLSRSEFEYPFLTNQFSDVYLHEVNAGAFNLLGAQAVLSGQFDSLLFDNDRFYIIVGSDSGMLVRYLINRGVPERSYYCIIEDSQILTALKRCPVPLPTADNVALLSFEEWEAHAQSQRLIEALILSQVQLVKSLSVLDAQDGRYPILYHQVETQLNQFRWSIQTEVCTQAFSKNQLVNLCDNQIPASILKNSFSGQPAILLAGGPSLDAALSWVQAHRETLFVAAVSRVSRRLQQVGLSPDLIISIDPTEKMMTVSREMFAFTDALFAQAYHVTPLLAGNWPGQQVYLGPRTPWDSDLNIDNIMVNGPTVTNAALLLMLEMGFSQIYLAGVDLAFAENGHTHAQGSDEHLAGPRLDFDGHYVELNNGGYSETDTAFYDAIQMLAAQAKLAAQRGCEVINVSHSAAKVSGVQYQSLADITLPSTPLDSKARLQRVYTAARSKQSQDSIAQVVKTVQQTQYRLDKIMALSSEAINAHDAPTAKQTERIERIEQTLSNSYADLLTLLKTFSFEAFQRLYRQYDTEDKQAVFEQSRAVFKGYKQAASTLQKYLLSVLVRVQNRLAEDQGELTASVMQQWVQDKQGGRAFIFQTRFPECYAKLKAPLQSQFDQCIDQFQSLLSGQDLPAVRTVSPLNWRVVQHKLNEQYRQKDLEKIKQTYVQLRELIELQAAAELAPEELPASDQHLSEATIESMQSVANLALGFIAELVGETDEAIYYYHQASSGGCVELALNRLSSLLLSLENIEQTALVLECLANLSPGYLPQHASMQKILGNYESAIESYKKYLTFSPKNYIVMLKLGLTYKELGQSHLAKPLLDEVAAEAPHLDAAQKN